MDESNRIKFAYYLKAWQYEAGNKSYLRKNAVEIRPSEYLTEMKGHIFCPECCVNLSRSPEEKAHASNGRKAFFAHSKKHSSECSLRVKRSEGKKYDSETLAKQAIEDEELVIVKSFLKEKSALPIHDGATEYGNYQNEDIDGGLSQVPIGRHKGEEFLLTSRITTVRSLCRNFDKNLYRYFFLPNQKSAFLLQDLLINVASVKEVCDIPKLYYGKITVSDHRGKTPQNIRMTWFEYGPSYQPRDFCLKTTDADSQEHGINDKAAGKFVLMYGKVTDNGIGLCIEKPGWGEFAVLPDEYAYLLDESA